MLCLDLSLGMFITYFKFKKKWMTGKEKEALINQTDWPGKIKIGGLGSLIGFSSCDIILGDTFF